MTTWSIEPLVLYRFVSPGPEVFFQRGFGTMVEMAIHAFLLHGADGTVLVDTGLQEDFSALNASIRSRKGPEAGFHPTGERLAARLAARAVAPTAIILTSFGPYAPGGLDGFGDVPVFASARGLADLARSEEPALSHDLDPATRSRLDRARKVAGRREILPGLTFFEAGVHHPASAALVVATPAGRIAIADPVFVRENLIEGLALGAAEHAGGWHRMVRLLAGQSDAMIPIHDPDPQPVPLALWHGSLRPAATDR